MDENKLGKRILALRTERGMTQEEAAGKLGVSNKAFSKWETGANLPDVPTVVKLAEFFGVTTDSLLGLADTEPQSFGTAVAAWFAAHPENPADALLRMHEEILGVSKEYLYHNGNDGKRWTPEVRNAMFPRRNCVTVNSCQFTVNSPEVNLSFALFRNEKDFAWLKDGEKRKGITMVFSTDCSTKPVSRSFSRRKTRRSGRGSTRERPKRSSRSSGGSGSSGRRQPTSRKGIRTSGTERRTARSSSSLRWLMNSGSGSTQTRSGISAAMN